MYPLYLMRGSGSGPTIRTSSTSTRTRPRTRRIPRTLSRSQQVARKATIALAGAALLIGATVAAQALVMDHPDIWQAGMIAAAVGGVVFNFALAKDSPPSIEHLSDEHIYRVFISCLFTVLMPVNFVGIYLVAMSYRSYLALPVFSMICLYFALVRAHFPIRKLNKCGTISLFVSLMLVSLLIPVIIMPPPNYQGNRPDYFAQPERDSAWFVLLGWVLFVIHFGFSAFGKHCEPSIRVDVPSTPDPPRSRERQPAAAMDAVARVKYLYSHRSSISSESEASRCDSIDSSDSIGEVRIPMPSSLLMPD